MTLSASPATRLFLICVARSALRSALAQPAISPDERKILDNVQKRVLLWDALEPFYSDEKVGPMKTPQSHGTESVLNALILASYETQDTTLHPASAKAFASMWALQIKTGDKRGAWPWLNFQLQPWEAEEFAILRRHSRGYSCCHGLPAAIARRRTFN